MMAASWVLSSPGIALEGCGHLPERDRPERRRAIGKSHRHRDAALAFDLDWLAAQPQQSNREILALRRKARAKTRYCTINRIERRRGAIKAQGDALLLRDGRQKLLHAHNVETQGPIEPARLREPECAG